MKTMTLEQFREAIRSQNVPMEHYAFICPMCGTVQSASDLIGAGAGKCFEEVEKYLAFSCVGRFNGAPSPRKSFDGKPCNWTLGGIFQTHELEVIHEGKAYPRFVPATPEQAQAHMKGGAA